MSTTKERQITVTISVKEIMLEMARFAYTIGENIGDDQAKMRHFIQGLMDKGHGELVKQRIDQAWTDVLDTVSAYLVSHICKCNCDWCKAHRGDCGCDCDSCTGANSDSNDCTCGCSGSATTEEDYLYRLDRWAWSDYVMVLHFPENTYPELGRRIATSARSYMCYQGRAEWETLTGRDSAKSELQAERAKNRLRVTIHARTTVAHTSSTWNTFIKF